MLVIAQIKIFRVTVAASRDKNTLFVFFIFFQTMSHIKLIDNNVKLLYESTTLGKNADDAKKIVGDLGASIISNVTDKNIGKIVSFIYAKTRTNFGGRPNLHNYIQS